MNTPDIGTTVPVDFANAFDDWIGGAAIAMRSVEIYGKPGLFAEWEHLARLVDRAERLAEADESLAETGELADLRERQQALYDEWMASKSTWYVRALTQEQAKAVDDQIASYDDPKEPADNADEATREAYEAAVKEVEAKRDEANDERALRMIVAALDHVEFANGSRLDAITIEQLRVMRGKLGERQILTLMSAATAASYQEPEIPAPFSRRTSQTDQT